MKRFFLVLLAMAMLASAVSAMAPSHPPGVLALEAALPGYDIDIDVAILDMVPAIAPLFRERPAGMLAVLVYEASELPQGAIKTIDTGQKLMTVAPLKPVDYSLLC